MLRGLARAVALALGALVAGAGCSGSFGSQQGYEPPQPIAFSHALHAGEYKMDCKYCHYGAERSRHAGIPALSVCMNCHTQVKTESPEIQKLAQAYANKQPISWIRVHRLPDFAYFSHASHVVAGGQQCQTCHGPVEQMVRIQQVETMAMGWCVNCHRSAAETSGGKLSPPTDCAACHF